MHILHPMGAYDYKTLLVVHTYLSRYSKEMRSLATFSLFDTIFLRFSTVSVRSMIRSNCPPVVGVMLTVISSFSKTVPATQPHPSGVEEVNDDGDDEDNNNRDDEGVDNVVIVAAGSRDEVPPLAGPWR